MTLKSIGKIFNKTKKEDKRQTGQESKDLNKNNEQMAHLIEMIDSYHNLKKLTNNE